jgi:hypothetical protein
MDKSRATYFKTPYVDHLIAGTFAGAFTTLVFHPLDLVRTRLQVLDIRGVSSCFRSIVREEGVRAFYKGPSLLN